LALRQALEAHGCRLEEQIAGLLLDPTAEWSLKADLLMKLVPFVFPQLKPVDAEGTLTPEQASGMLGAQAVRFRDALQRYSADPTLVTQVLNDLRTHTTNGAGASPPPV
jgi:hypothetical protein